MRYMFLQVVTTQYTIVDGSYDVLLECFSVLCSLIVICHTLTTHTTGPNSNLSIRAFRSFEYTLLGKSFLAKSLVSKTLPLFLFLLLYFYQVLHSLLLLFFLLFQVLLSFLLQLSFT